MCILVSVAIYASTAIPVSHFNLFMGFYYYHQKRSNFIDTIVS